MECFSGGSSNLKTVHKPHQTLFMRSTKLDVRYIHVTAENVFILRRSFATACSFVMYVTFSAMKCVVNDLTIRQATTPMTSPSGKQQRHDLNVRQSTSISLLSTATRVLDQPKEWFSTEVLRSFVHFTRNVGIQAMPTRVELEWWW